MPVQSCAVGSEVACDGDLEDVAPIGDNGRTWDLTIDDQNGLGEAIRCHSLIRDVQMILLKSEATPYISKASYLDHLPGIWPFQVHVRINIELPIPAIS